MLSLRIDAHYIILPHKPGSQCPLAVRGSAAGSDQYPGREFPCSASSRIRAVFAGRLGFLSPTPYHPSPCSSVYWLGAICRGADGCNALLSLAALCVVHCNGDDGLLDSSESYITSTPSYCYVRFVPVSSIRSCVPVSNAGYARHNCKGQDHQKNQSGFQYCT